jgi:hypothetical protein
LDRVVELLANDHSGAHHVGADLVRTMDHVMSITSIFAGLLSLFTANETIDISQKVYSALNTAGKIIEKSEKNEWKASAHEEGYQITKDTILKIGGLK